MATKQGKVKAIPIDTVTEGMQVLTTLNTIGIVDGVYSWPEQNTRVKGVYYKQDSFRVLVVEYPCDQCDDFHTGFCNECRSNRVKQLPLKHKQWQAAIDNGEVNSDKVVEFEIVSKSCYHQCFGTQISRGICECAKTQYTKIIPKREPKLYTEDDMKQAFHAGVYCARYNERDYPEWIEYYTATKSLTSKLP